MKDDQVFEYLTNRNFGKKEQVKLWLENYLNDMEWEVGEGFRIGNSCKPVADSCQCVAKPIQYFKAK